MSTQLHYDAWSASYDSVENKTRDLEGEVCRQVLSDIKFDSVLELGAGTGKNTEWLAERASSVIAVDFSEEMQAVARRNVIGANVVFRQADISKAWYFAGGPADLITCSLILEHVEDIDFIFGEASGHLAPSGHLYVCELHPFRQYTGTKARFETAQGMQHIDAFTHHISDYTDAANKAGLRLTRFDEWFDDDDRNSFPRLASFLFRRD